MVIWLIGLSGSGKTTLGSRIYAIWKEIDKSTVVIDGDEIREIFKHNRSNDAYTIEGRSDNAERICALCAWLDRQDINVVCNILSLFHESRIWNRENYSKYYEVFISVPMGILKKRDNKNIYAQAYSGKMKNVVGVDIPFVPPVNPDYIFENHTDNIDMDKIALDILNQAGVYNRRS